MEDLDAFFGAAALSPQLSQQELLRCNAVSSRFGLTLSPRELGELTEGRRQALLATGRIEFGGGILPKLVSAFCASPYLQSDDYAETLLELQDAFYYFKNECRDALGDDELIAYMAKIYDGAAQGSMDYLCGTALPALCRRIRAGLSPHARQEDEE